MLWKKGSDNFGPLLVAVVAVFGLFSIFLLYTSSPQQVSDFSLVSGFAVQKTAPSPSDVFEVSKDEIRLSAYKVDSTPKVLGTHPLENNGLRLMLLAPHNVRPEDVHSLPFQEDLSNLLALGHCNSKWGFQVEQGRKDLCSSTNVVGFKLFINRYVRFHFDVATAQTAMNNAELKEIQVKVRSSRKLDNPVDLVAFITVKGDPKWHIRGTKQIKPNDGIVKWSIGFTDSDEAASIDQVIIARGSFDKTKFLERKKGMVFITDMELVYTPSKTVSDATAVSIFWNDPASGELIGNTVPDFERTAKLLYDMKHPSPDGQKSSFGKTLPELLAENGGVLTADITLANGKKMTVTLGQSKCLADGGAGTPLEEHTKGMGQAQVQELAGKIEQATGHKMAGDVQDLINGRRANDKQKFTVCDNTKRCEDAQNLLKKAGGYVFGSDAAGDRNPLFNERGSRIGADPRLMQGGGATGNNDQEGAFNEFHNAMTAAGKSGQKASTFSGTIAMGSNLFNVGITRAPSGASSVRIAPLEKLNAMGQDLGLVVNNAKATTTYVGAGNQQGQADMTQLKKDATSPENRNAVSQIKSKDKEETQRGLNKAVDKKEIAQAAKDKNAGATYCSPQDEKCDKASAKRLKKSFDALNRFLPEAGQLGKKEEKIDYNKRSAGKRGKVSPGAVNPNPSDQDSSNLFSTVDDGCLIMMQKITDAGQPGPMQDRMGPDCQKTCKAKDAAVGHTCKQDNSRVDKTPLGTCPGNFILNDQQRNAIDCPPDNPNCGQMRRKTCADGSTARILCSGQGWVVKGCPENANMCPKGGGEPKGGSAGGGEGSV